MIRKIRATPFLANFKKVSFNILDQGLFSTANFLVSLLLARWLSSKEYGAFSVAFSIFLLLAGIQTAFFSEPMAIFGPLRNRDLLSHYMGQVGFFQFLVNACLGTIVMIVSFFLDASVKSVFLGLGISLPWILLYWYSRQACYIEGKTKVAAIGSTIYFLSLILGIFLVYRYSIPSDWTGFLLMGLSGLLASAYVLANLGVRIRVSFTQDFLVENWRYGKWILVASILAWITAWAYPLIINAYAGLAEAGAFRAMQNFVLPLQQGLAAITLLVLPMMSRIYKTEGAPSLMRFTRRMIFYEMIFSGLYVLLLVWIGGWAIETAYQSELFNQYVWMLPLLGISILTSIPGLIITLAFRALQTPSYIFYVKVISIAFLFSAGFYFISVKKLEGVVLSILLISVIETVASLILLNLSNQGKNKASSDVGLE